MRTGSITGEKVPMASMGESREDAPVIGSVVVRRSKLAMEIHSQFLRESA